MRRSGLMPIIGMVMLASVVTPLEAAPAPQNKEAAFDVATIKPTCPMSAHGT